MINHSRHIFQAGIISNSCLVLKSTIRQRRIITFWMANILMSNVRTSTVIHVLEKYWW